MRLSEDGKTVIEIEHSDIIDGVLTIPEGVERLANELCRGEIEISQLELRKGLTIGDMAFYNRIVIKELTIPEDVTIEGRAFAFCFGITKLNIAKGVTIGESVFESCCEIAELTIDERVKLERKAFQCCPNIIDLNITADVTIGEYAFYGCHGITKLMIAKGVTIAPNAFFGCVAIQSIEIDAIEGSNEYQRILSSLPESLHSTVSSCAMPQKAAVSNLHKESSSGDTSESQKNVDAYFRFFMGNDARTMGVDDGTAEMCVMDKSPG